MFRWVKEVFSGCSFDVVMVAPLLMLMHGLTTALCLDVLWL